MTICNLPSLKAILTHEERLLGLDFGTKRIGLAISDPTRCIALPLDTLKRSRLSSDVTYLADIAHFWKVGGFIIGLPLHMNGQESQSVHHVRRFAADLIDHTHLFDEEPDIVFWDERWSTVAVTRTLRKGRLKRSQQAKVIDRLAATYILQGALDALRTAHTE